MLVTLAKDGVIEWCTEGPGKELDRHAGEARPLWKDMALLLLRSCPVLVDADAQRALAKAERPLLGRLERVLPGTQRWGG